MNKFYKNLDRLYGIGSDSKDGSGLSKVQIFIKRLSDNYFWNGEKWIPIKTFLETSGTSNWEYDSSSVKWTSDSKYFVQSRAIDNVSNIEISSSCIEFFIDMEPPVSTIQFPLNDSYLNELDMIFGISQDHGGSEVDLIEISIMQTNNNNYWDGKNWVVTECWLTVSGKNNWYFNTNNLLWITDNYYNIRIRAIDYVNNLETPDPGITFMYDDKAPDISISINNNDKYTNSTKVTLSLSAIDTGSDILQVRYSADTNIWTSWEGFNKTISFNLNDGDGNKNIFYQVKDKANNSAMIYDTIILDTTPPYDLIIIINNGFFETNSSSVTLRLFAIDNLSGIDQMSFRTDGRSWSLWENYSTIKSYNLPSSNGKKTIYFRAKDKAGNIADTVSARILLNITTPKPESEPEIIPESQSNPPEKEKSSSKMIYWIFLIIIIILIIILIVGIAIAKRKKQFKNEPEHDLPSVDAINVKPIISTTSVTPDAQLPAQQIVTLPPTTPTIEPSTPTFTPKPITISSIANSSKPQTETPTQVQAPPLQQISQPVQIPQLPRAQSQITETKANLPQTPSIQSQPESLQPQILPETSQSVQQNLCLICGKALTFIQQNNKYYCYQCKKYE